MEPQNEKTANSFGPEKVCGNSTNNEVHNGRQGPRADLSTWPEGFKLQGPLDGTTTYGVKIYINIESISGSWRLLKNGSYRNI